jgi:hypothetical protein
MIHTKGELEKIKGGLYVEAANEVHQNLFEMKSVQFDGHKLGNVLIKVAEWVKENDVFIHDVIVKNEGEFYCWVVSVYYR